MVLKGVAQREVRRVGAGGSATGAPELDFVAVEEPLEIRVATEPIAVTMRTPGDDAKLALGFLFGEGILSSAADVGSVAHCGRLGEEGYGNVIDVTAAAGVVLEIEKVQASRRGTLTTSACGVCGRRSIDDLMSSCARLPSDVTLPLQLVATAVNGLGERQQNFASTGGVHAALALDARGQVLAAFEDVGRHNAVDKVVGALLQTGQLGAAVVLAVSGRASFEIVQKATRAGILAVVSVSAASTLAIDLAQRANLTLASFARGGRLNVYAGFERLASSVTR